MRDAIGVDEVGRGCLAGPMLVVAARAMSQLPPGLRDSKLLSRKQRQEILNLLSNCCDFGEGWVSSAEIDELGLTMATRLGVKRALSALKVPAEAQIIIDGHINYAPGSFSNVQAVIDADDSVAIVSAASIYAKVKRDNYMIDLSIKHPGYGFEKHVGYGTAFHLAAIKSLGAVEELHRLSFAPLKRLIVS